MESNYKPIGQLIEKVDERNTDGSVSTLVGLSIDKCFIKSVANIIGTDLTKYKIIRKKYFAVSLMQVSRDEKIPVAMQTDYEVAIMSPAYPIFKVSDENIILPEYLDMWFKRAEFDREATFIAVGGVRGSMPWEDFCRMEVYVPPLEKQKEIVKAYRTITDRIALKQKINDNLEATAQAIYNETFINASKKHWNKGVVGDVLQLQRGHDLPRIKMNGGLYPVAGSTETIGYHDEYTTLAPVIVMGRSGNIGNPRIYFCNCWVHNTSLYVKNFYLSEPLWTFFLLKNLNYDSFVGGSAVPTLNRNDVHAYEIQVPPIELQKQFSKQVYSFFINIEKNNSEISKLIELKNVVLATISNL
ncbi:MAG: restriction endonuclease subunit S [Ruminococcus sp.]|nr:restriction endonuclease subunit S [Ruminococcus sp.]